MTITGLPLHPLVIHAVVVLLPLMAVLTVLVAVRRSLRERVAWWVVLGNAIIFGTTVLAKESGEDLQKSLGGKIALEHGQLGSLLPLFALVMLVASAGVALTRRHRSLGPVAVIVSILASGAAVFWTVRTGDSGARALWAR